jgi:hypothetical protein
MYTIECAYIRALGVARWTFSEEILLRTLMFGLNHGRVGDSGRHVVSRAKGALETLKLPEGSPRWLPSLLCWCWHRPRWPTIPTCLRCRNRPAAVWTTHCRAALSSCPVRRLENSSQRIRRRRRDESGWKVLIQRSLRATRHRMLTSARPCDRLRRTKTPVGDPAWVV